MLNGHLRSLTHLVENIIAIFWCKFGISNNKIDLDIVYISCFGVNIKQISVMVGFGMNFAIIICYML